MTLVIRNGRLLDPSSGADRPIDLRIDGETITDIAAPRSIDTSGAIVIDATGMWITPGLCDMHVHLREPGEEYKEDIESGSQAAVAGGFTTIVAMPNTQPVIDGAELIAFVARRGRDVGSCRVLPTGAVSVGQRGKQLAPFGDMRRAGAVAVTDDGHPVSDSGLMRHALEYSRDFDLPVLTHAEDLSLSDGGHMHEGEVSTRLGIHGISRVAEDAAVARDIMLAEFTGGHLHVCHVSTAAAVEGIRQAKARGVAVTGEAAPHHFTLTDAAVDGFATDAKMNPPLREESDRRAVIDGLRDGTLDAIASDHAPHSSIQKDVAFVDAACGIIGMQTALPLSLALWRDYDMPVLDVIERLTAGPARVLDLGTGRIAPGAPADVTVIDPDVTWRLMPEDIRSKSHNTPFLGRELRGRACATVFGGKVVFRHR